MHISYLIKKTVQYRMVQHVLFWAISFYVLLRLFAYSDQVAAVDVIYTFLFHLSIFLAVYVNLIWLIPYYLHTRKYTWYFILLIVLVAISIGCNLFTFNYLSDLLFPDYYFIAYYGFWEIAQFIIAYIIITSLIKLSKSWFQYQEMQSQLRRLESEKSAAEMSALKSQMNPHFLFNSLNNLYALALDRDDRTPSFILRLSQTMRYLLYESNTDFGPLEKEIEHLQNFVEMQGLRVGEKAKISFEVQGDPAGKQVAPLLFLPLVENGFKHGIKGDTAGAFIKINLHILDHQLVLKTENNKGIVDEVKSGSYSGGVGLENLKRRLSLLYPGKHRLEITDGMNTFIVILKIDTA